MKALITGASSGLGFKMAHILSDMGYDIVAVARREERLDELKNELKTNVDIVVADVSDIEQCSKISEFAKDVDVFINNAGFGVFGDFSSSDLDKEISMIKTNVMAVHILTKRFLQEFKKRNSGYILNVASLAAFFPGPLFGAYYASKSYVLRLTQAAQEEIRREKSNVKISVLCPGPVHTEFSDVAMISFGSGTEKLAKYLILESDYVSQYAISKMFLGKKVIIPGVVMRMAVFARHFLSDKMISKLVYMIQSKKFIAK